MKHNNNNEGRTGKTLHKTLSDCEYLFQKLYFLILNISDEVKRCLTRRRTVCRLGRRSVLARYYSPSSAERLSPLLYQHIIIIIIVVIIITHTHKINNANVKATAVSK